MFPLLQTIRATGIRTKLSALFYLTAFFAMAAIGLYGYFNASKAYRQHAVELLESSRNEIVTSINAFIHLERNDLNFINDFYAILRYAYWKDIGDTAKMEEWRTIAGDTLHSFAENYRYYHKIRFIDRDGQEMIHVETDPVSGQARLLDDHELRNDAGQDYMVEGLKLKRGETYVSAMDFSTRQGQVEKNLTPVLRFVQPLIGDNQVLYGLIVSNIRASAIYDFIRQANKNALGRTFYLVDAQGNFLFHPDADKQFGHLLGHGHHFDQEHHHLLAEMRGQPEGVITRSGHIHVFRTILPNPQQPDRYWFLVGVVDEATALAELNAFVAVFLALLAVLTLIVLSSTRYMVGQIMTPLGFVTRQLEHLGRGETRPETLDYPARDEIRQMLDSTERLVANLDALAHQADAIASGDLSGQVVPLSERDRLGLALNNMTRQLAENHRTDRQRNWLKDGLAELARALAGDLEAQRLADLAIAQVGRTLGAGRGVLYVWNKHEQVLELLGSYMFTERHALGARVKPGEGAVGQVAREQKPIILHAGGASAHHDPLPVITTGTLSVAPRYTYTWPLQRDGALQGVLEIAQLDALDETQLTYLNAAAETIAAFLLAVLQRSRIQELLVVAEASTREAQAQSRQLQAANVQMEEQQQQLQQQTAELQASNAQMEEQQQQLQQQTAELQASNAQMEEQQQLLEQRNRELLQSQKELDARAHQLELSSQYKSEFLANMSHELRTPLNAIILLAKMMANNEDRRLHEEDVKRAEVIYRAGQDLLHLINDVLDLSKIEAGRMELQVAPAATSALAEEFRDLFSDSAHDKGLELHIQDAMAAKILVDRDKLSQILRNLLSNAIKFTRQGSITLRFEHRAGEDLPLCISVQDTGIGVPEDKQAIIFEAFQQADGSTSREYGGTGLGLSISLSFARLMGGTLELASTAGKGSTFTLRLPDGSTPAPALSPSAGEEWPHDDREHIGDNDQVLLLIDDDPHFAQALLDINRRLGYRTLLAGSGREGLDLTRRFSPNGILLDLGLPDIDGSAVLHQLKSTPELSAIPVYILSARDRDNALITQGALGYLHKPVDSQQIAAAEASVLAQWRETAGQGLLLVENGSIDAAGIAPLLGGQRNPIVTLPAALASREALTEALATTPCRLAIIDLGARVAVAREIAARLRRMAPGLAILFYGKTPLSDEEDAGLRQFSDSIIIKTPQAERRLQENIERFLKQTSLRRQGRTALSVPEGSGSKRLSGRHVLVVDDDPRNLFVITAALEQHGATVENALNGHRALDLLATLRPDLVLMDIMMPEMDGYKTIAAMRADPRLAGVPILALTAKALPSDREQALAAGADDYLAKPADYEVLINMAAAWCEGRR